MSSVSKFFADKAIVEGQLGQQLGLIQLRLIRHVLIWIAALFEVSVVVVAEMSDGVCKLIDARLSQRFHEVVERGGEKLTRVHKDDAADLQQHVTLAIKRNDTHVSVCLRPRPRRICGVLLAKELQHEVSIIQ